MNDTARALIEARVIAIVRGVNEEGILPLARALEAGGVRAIEVTFDQRDPDSWPRTLRAIERIAREFNGRVLPGAGTVLTPAQVDMAFSAGARYIISPDVNEDVIARTRAHGLASLPGALTPSEVMRAVFGIDPRESGEIFIHGQKVEISSTVDALKAGLGFVPEDRKEQGLILKQTIRVNTSLAALSSVAKNWFIDKKRETALTDEFVSKLRVKTPSNEQKIMNLSGGNQQKVVIAKWMATHPKVLILDEPTRGIDVGAKKEIHALMSELAKQGVAIIMISSELPEVLGMSDRIYVMHDGRIKGEIDRANASQESIMKLAIS